MSSRELSFYEKQRLDNIRRNNAYLESLGLAGKPKFKGKKRGEKKKRAAATTTSPKKRRKSPRLLKENDSNKKEIETFDKKEEKEEAPAQLRVSVREISKENNDVVCDQLKAAYCLSFSKKHGLAAAGKAGRVAIFNEKATSFKNSSAWIGGLLWLERENGLVTAGNDGMIRIINTSNMIQENSLKTDSGIWSLHASESHDQIITSDKKANLRLYDLNLSLIRQYDNCSICGGIKNCSFVSSHLIATAQDDGKINLWDLRHPSSQPQWSVFHSTSDHKAHSVLSMSEFLLLSAGQDHAIRLWDIRKGVSSPSSSYLEQFYGHHPSSSSNALYSALRHPIKLSESSFIAAGQGNASIALYHLSSPKPRHLFSHLPADATTLTPITTSSFFAALALSDAALIRRFEV
mmetsp:Transcript_12749/g.15432  ORF Transcript_12749/g.15432 Transcript_12749/m.15432 type:complete len:405 (+) Transcript_12749:51-1265(+)